MGTMSSTSPAHSRKELGPRTSELLLRALHGDTERVTVGEILDALDNRAFGLATLIFSIPSIVPMPPGVPTVASPDASVGAYRLRPKEFSPAGFWKLASVICPAFCAWVCPGKV